MKIYLSWQEWLSYWARHAACFIVGHAKPAHPGILGWGWPRGRSIRMGLVLRWTRPPRLHGPRARHERAPRPWLRLPPMPLRPTRRPPLGPRDVVPLVRRHAQW